MSSRKHKVKTPQYCTMQQDINLLNSLASGRKKKSHPRKLRQYYLTPAFLHSVWPEYEQPPTTLADMSEEGTAIWVEIIGSFKGWKEARDYAQSFKNHGVTGHVLPYLSVKSLQSELNIWKFGHRIEIIAAIEKNEFTLMNPFIVSFCSDALINSLKKFYGSQSQRTEKSENIHFSEDKVKEWLSKIRNKTSLSFKTRKKGSSYNGSASPEADFKYDRDPQNVVGEDILMPKNPWISPSAIKYEDNSRVKETLSKSEDTCIPPSGLPPTRRGLDVEMKWDDFTKELVRGAEERLSTLFSKAKSETTASCKCKRKKSCWASLAA